MAQRGIQLASALAAAALAAGLLAGPFFPGFASAAAKGDPDALVRKGAELMAQRDYRRAASSYDQAIELAPETAQYYYLRARARYADKQAGPAMADLDKALALSPDHIDARIERAAERTRSGDPNGAAPDIDAAARLSEDRPDYWLRIANLYVEATRLDEALKRFDRFLKTGPKGEDEVRALNGLCWTRTMAKVELDQALADCDRALALGGRLAPAVLDTRGLLHLRKGEYELAIADYDAALGMAPRLAWSYYGRGVAKLNKGLTRPGKADIAAAVAISPTILDEGRKFGVLPPP